MFLGTLGKIRVFIVCDSTTEMTIPSDYDGITRGHYDGTWVGTNAISAVSSACSVIERSIQMPATPSPYAAYAGQWKSKYASGPDPIHQEVIDDVEVKVEGDRITLESNAVQGSMTYKGHGQIYYDNQIMGEWNHPENTSLAEGLFVLTVTPTADAMYGYSTSRDADGAMIYGTWALQRRMAAQMNTCLIH